MNRIANRPVLRHLLAQHRTQNKDMNGNMPCEAHMPLVYVGLGGCRVRDRVRATQPSLFAPVLCTKAPDYSIHYLCIDPDRGGWCG
jgi:hypothetical protein